MPEIKIDDLNKVNFNDSVVIALYDKKNNQILSYEVGQPYLYLIKEKGKSSFKAWVNDRKQKIGKEKFEVHPSQQEILKLKSMEKSRLIFISTRGSSMSFNKETGAIAPLNKRYKSTIIGETSNQLVRYILSNIDNELFSEDDWKETIKYFDQRCAYCGEKAELQIDHAIPINKDKLGEHKLGNIVPCCRNCNNAKHHKDYREFLINQPQRIKKIEQYMRSKNYHPLHNCKNARVIKTILEHAYKENKDSANRYIKIINDMNSYSVELNADQR